MRPTQVNELVTRVSQIWPSMKLAGYTPDAWEPILEDLDYDDAYAAVYALARSHPGYIQPYDIRRQVADTAGLLPPDEADALRQAAAVAGLRGEGASRLHPAVQAAYRAMGGAVGFDAPPEITRPQWGRVYRDATARHERELLAGDLGAAITAHRRELDAASRPAIEAPPANPTVRNRSVELSELVARFGVPPGSRRALHGRQVAWEQAHRDWQRQRNAVPNPHYDPTHPGVLSHPEAS